MDCLLLLACLVLVLDLFSDISNEEDRDGGGGGMIIISSLSTFKVVLFIFARIFDNASALLDGDEIPGPPPLAAVAAVLVEGLFAVEVEFIPDRLESVVVVPFEVDDGVIFPIVEARTNLLPEAVTALPSRDDDDVAFEVDDVPDSDDAADDDEDDAILEVVFGTVIFALEEDNDDGVFKDDDFTALLLLLLLLLLA